MYKIIENTYIGEDMYQMKVQGEFKGRMGQFYMLRAWDTYPTLSRPISIHDIDENSITFLYKVVGEGTKIFSRLTPGDNIKLEGPYGNGYQKVEGKVALVGGGIGVAPLYLVAKNIPNCDAYLGFRNEPILIDKYEEVYKADKLLYDNYLRYNERLRTLAQRLALSFNVFLIKDTKGLLDIKDSPLDKGKDVYNQLIKLAKPVYSYGERQSSTSIFLRGN